MDSLNNHIKYINLWLLNKKIYKYLTSNNTNIILINKKQEDTKICPFGFFSEYISNGWEGHIMKDRKVSRWKRRYRNKIINI